MALLKRPKVRALLIIGGLLLLYLVTRLINLTLLPIFTDEAIYIRWSQIGSQDATWRFISMVDGKQPLFTWIMMVFLRFISDPLLAGRLVSTVAGIGTTIGIWFVANELFKNKNIAFLSSFLYIIIPFGLMYDRLALYDSLSAALSIWNLYLGILLVRRSRLDIALILGLVLGLGMLNKTSGFLSLYMLPFTLILFDWSKKNRNRRLFSWIGLAFLAAVISQFMYGILRLSPLFAMIGQKDTVFIYSFSEWLTHPFNFLIGNLRGLFDWAIGYLTLPLFYAGLCWGLMVWKFPREKLLLLTWWFAPFFALALTGRVLYPRFVLFMVLPLMILASGAISWIWNRFKGRAIGILLLFVLITPSLRTDYFIILHPLYAPIPDADAGQYIDHWPSGWGVSEVNALLESQAQKGKVSVYTDGTFGLLPYAIEIYLVDNPNMKIRGLYPIPSEIPPEVIEDAVDHPTYIVFNQLQNIPQWPMEFVASYQKGKRTDMHLRIYKITPPQL